MVEFVEAALRVRSAGRGGWCWGLTLLVQDLCGVVEIGIGCVRSTHGFWGGARGGSKEERICCSRSTHDDQELALSLCDNPLTGDKGRTTMHLFADKDGR